MTVPQVLAGAGRVVLLDCSGIQEYVFGSNRLLVFKPGDKITIRALTDTHFTVVGGAPMDGPRHIWWNFVSSRKDRIEQAKAEWTAGHFQKVPGDEIEFIPLPEK